MTAKKRPEEIQRNKERANRKRKLRHLWRGEMSLSEVADDLGISVQELITLASRMNLGPRPEVDVYVPSPEEIRLKCAEIRAGWTKAELEARRMPWFGRLK